MNSARFHYFLNRALLSFLIFFGFGIFFIKFAYADGGSKESELRCGWFDNPSPGNAELIDVAGAWLIAQQGEYKAEGAWPKFSAGQWIQTGVGSYGYGCLCILGKFESKNRKVLEVEKAITKPINLCRRDKKISELEPFNPLK